MPGDNAASAPQPAPEISADFLTGNTETGLDRIRTRLLDLTNRNKLLNYRHPTASSLRVVNSSVEETFQRLIENEKIPFAPVPEPPYSEEEIPSAKDYAEQLGWDTSFDLDLYSPEPRQNGRSMPVLHYPEQLDVLSRKIGTAARTAVEESGTNMLYLVFGFLEWYEADDSKQSHLAPLITVPVTLERSGSRGKLIESVVEYSGEDIESNLSLAEKMRRDFGLEIPIIGEDDTPGSYFARFAEILAIKKGWRIRPQITLALLSFGKLLMYRDLNPKTWPVKENISRHPLVRQLFEGTKKSHVALADELPIDAPELKTSVPLLIRDADSSQHSALIHALRGQNLVLEGPPGTGKSQTITNLIAAALAAGKKVLFVSEKLAALEVVRRRLDEAGLGMFCLEVHSHKTKKGALLNDIAERQKAHGTFRDPQDLDRQLATAEEKKRQLTQYANLINKTIEPFGATIFDILWAREQYGQETRKHQEDLGQLLLPACVQFGKQEFASAEHFLSIYSEHLKSVLGSSGSLTNHPWNWVSRPCSFEEEDRLFNSLERFLGMTERASNILTLLDKTAGIRLPHTLEALASTAFGITLLPEPPTLPRELLHHFRASDKRQKLEQFAEAVDRFHKKDRLLRYSTTDTSAILQRSNRTELQRCCEDTRKWDIDSCSVRQVKTVLNQVMEIEERSRAARSSMEALLRELGLNLQPTLFRAATVKSTFHLLENAPVNLLHLRHATLEGESSRALLEAARQESEKLRAQQRVLADTFDLASTAAYDAPELFTCAVALETTPWWSRWFDSRYRAGKRMFRQLTKNGNRSSRMEKARHLRQLGEYRNELAAFEGNADYKNVFGPSFTGLETEWDDLGRLVGWYEQVFALLPDHIPETEWFRHLLLSARVERLRALQTVSSECREQCSTIELALSSAKDFSRTLPACGLIVSKGSFEELDAFLRELKAGLSELLSSCELCEISNNVIVRDIPDILLTAEECSATLERIENDQGASEILGPHFKRAGTELEPIRNSLAFADSLCSGKLPARVADWLLCEEYDSRLQTLRAWLSGAHECSEEWRILATEITAVTGSSVINETADVPWESLREVVEKALTNREHLSSWNHFLRLRAESVETGLVKLTALADSQVLSADELGTAFHFCFFNTLARSVFGQFNELSRATGITQEQLKTQFSVADRESIRLYRQRVAAIVDRRSVPYGNQSGPVRTWTENALITNEINKQKRHIPIRQLMLRAANALIALKPCFMMSPLSVAQYLAPGQIEFDLVVMDEASQLKPEDAIGALARGGQIVVVGDPKQLPPTTFFQRVSLDAEDEEEEVTAVEEGESILDVASTLFQPVRRLRWHYRSRHHSLIAFSNKEFYGSDLIVFPSAYNEDPSLGVKYHPVPDGIFENRRNPREAAVLVQAVLDHMRDHPDESLGVVTLNFEQRELVEELLDRQLREDPAALAYQIRMHEGQEKFFIKNLENVQGDERDVMFISVTYGQDSRGNQYQRFGPINASNGYRRLNVLFTRAKKRTVIFSSLDPDRIQTTPSSPWGLRALKEYLIFARTGVLEQPEEAAGQAVNDFERAVGTVLKSNGYDVVPQVGVAGFFIDIGVKHPFRPGAFLLGIECDGASYHSGRSARDRDRLRQEILVNLGWKIHRIWSTDWFRNRDAEIKRLLATLQALLERDPSYQSEKKRVTSVQQLRDRLVSLRETEIKRAFPDSPPEKGLLRKSLLDEFIEKRPKSRDDWFRKIPQQLRTSVDSGQIGKYLDRVLAIIAEAD